MELRSQKTNLCLIVLSLLTPLAAQNFEFPARHHDLPRKHAGTLKLTPEGVSFERTKPGKAKSKIDVAWLDIQEFELTDNNQIRVTTYADRRLLLGKDQSYLFTLTGKPGIPAIYASLKDKLGPRLIARLADTTGTPQWSLPAKHVKAIQGSEGVLHIFEDKIVYESKRPAQSRTWRIADLPNISTAGPYQFSFGVEEFQLKAPLDPAKYEALWLSLNRPKGLELISTKKEPQP
ncbi:MAG TPA: hypothetical protein VGK29_27195 [Paludibaculum sp.]|jgi:hypothetical protein